MKTNSIFIYGLFFLVIIVLAAAWPICKIGLVGIPPLWYTVAQLFIGFVTIFIILLIQNNITLPKKQDLPLILSIGLLQMDGFLVLLNAGLQFVEAGRSAILVYSTPIWVTPIAILFFKERFTRKKMIGLFLGFGGIVVLFNPWNFDWYNSKQVVGNIFLLLAAICWAAAIIHTRYGKWHSPSLQLVPWQLLIAFIFVLVTVLIMEPKPNITWSPKFLGSVLYTGMFATGFAYAALIYISQRFSVITTSLLLLGVPVLGLLFSAWWLQEKLAFDTLLAIFLIISGLLAIVLDERKGRFFFLKSLKKLATSNF